jgi:DNA-binding response OmpR family regulator
VNNLSRSFRHRDCAAQTRGGLWSIVVLLVEDDRPSRRNLAAFLRSTGYEVYEAEDGEIALSLLTNMQFDVVISDLNLPGNLSGIDILNALKNLPRQVDGILITGTGSNQIKSRAKSLGAAYMEKPIQLRELEKTIEQRARK